MPASKDTKVVIIDTAPNTVTITSGQSLSTALDLIGGTLCALQVASSITGNQIGFQYSFDGVTYSDDYMTSGALYTIAVPLFSGVPSALTLGGVRLPPGMWGGIRSIKLATYDNSNNRVNQSVTQTITISSRPML